MFIRTRILASLLLVAAAACLVGGRLYTSAARQAPEGGTKVPATLTLGSKGDPVAGKIWGQNDRWLTVSFNHTAHESPDRSASCEVCHHTNKDARSEPVPRCVACHKEAGNEANPTTEDGDEIDVKLAFHGRVGAPADRPGCLACHTRRDTGRTNCAGCHRTE